MLLALDRAVLIEESFVGKTRQGRLSLALMQLLLTAVVAASIIKSVVTAISDFPVAVYVGDILAMIVGIAMIHTASNEMNAAFKRGYDAAKATAGYNKDDIVPDHPC